jgi:SsrA-binding protein
MKIFATNKYAYFDYEITDKIEAGISLLGNEVKSIKNNQIKLQGAYVIFSDGILTLINCHISPYSLSYHGTAPNPLRNRVLLVHKTELRKLFGKVSQKGYALLPLKIYANERGYIKLEVGLGKHKKLHDKKQVLKERDLDREAKRDLKNN